MSLASVEGGRVLAKNSVVLIVSDSMQQTVWMLLLVCLQNLFHVLVDVVRGLDRGRQVHDRFPSDVSLLMVILNLNVNDMDRSVEVSSSGQQIIADRVETSFFTGNDDVCDCLALLPPFWRQFYSSVPVKHLQKPVCGVKPRILGLELFVNIVVRRPECIDVWLVYCGTR